MLKSKKFQIKMNDKKFDISLELTSNNLIIIINLEDFPPIKFLGSFTLSDLFKICNWFKMFESVMVFIMKLENFLKIKKLL
jgi:hypothetical protein